MSFLSPIFLFAIAAVAVPLIIHFLNFKRAQKVVFSTVSFFKELQKTTIRRIKLKSNLLLIVRLLAILCLALVLARPFLPPGVGNTNSDSPALNVILLDNSISMARIGDKGPLLEQGKQIIAQLEASSKEIDRFIFQTTNGEEQFISVINHSKLLSRLDEVEASLGGNYISQRVASLLSALQNSPFQNKRFFIVSDGQISQLSKTIDTIKIPRSVTTTFFNLGSVEVQNTLITALELESDIIGIDEPARIRVQVQNNSEIPINNQFITLEFEGSIVGQYSIDLPPRGYQYFSFEVIPKNHGTVTGSLTIEGDEFVLDNVKYFTIQVPQRRDILWVKSNSIKEQHISFTNIALDASNKSNAQLGYKKIAIQDFETVMFENYEAIIFDELPTIPEFFFKGLQSYVQNGGGIIVIPSEQLDIKNYNTFFREFNIGEFVGVSGNFASSTSVAVGDQFLENHPIFKDVFDLKTNERLSIARPDIYYYYLLKPSISPGGFNIITLNSGYPLFREQRVGEGKILVSTIGNNAAWSNFGVKPLFAPFYFRSLLYVASSTQGGLIGHTLGNEFSWSGEISTDQLILNYKEDIIVPDTKASTSGIELTYDAIEWEPGFVSIKNRNVTLDIALNIDDSESDFLSFGEEELTGSNLNAKIVTTTDIPAQELTNQILATSFGQEIWQWFMWAGFFFLILELLISLFYKTELSS